jgi:hypothetical protein
MANGIVKLCLSHIVTGDLVNEIFVAISANGPRILQSTLWRFAKTMAKQLIPQSKVAARYNVHSETIKTWVRRRPDLGFPQPVVINGRYYFDVAQLDAFDAMRMRKPDGAHLANGHEHETA